MNENAARPFDRQLAERRRQRALANGPADFLFNAVADDLALRLSAVQRDFETALDLHGATGGMAALMAANPKVGKVWRCEASPVWLAGSGVVCDAEALPFAPDTLDLAVSCLGLQWVNDLAGSLVQLRRAMRGDGLLLMAIVGGDSLAELRESLVTAEIELTGGAAPRVAPMVDIRSLGALAGRAGFALPVCDVDTLTIRYDNMFALLRDLRAMGATSPLNERSRKPLRRAVLLRAAEIYAQRFSDADGRVRARFDILHLSTWAPHESQPKPLKPGTAKMRLADVLPARSTRDEEQ
ncbi:MAG: methyltransferase domain-containing protein [Rhodobiaceae bacterium]|nr:methyltransferase domain-containing protein [Rhodobiaceae bacterium]MCC0056918.1 methyltransferase domain-containing protein [Rhodobiaceae bacterium]